MLTQRDRAVVVAALCGLIVAFGPEATSAQRAPQGVPAQVTKPLRISPRPGNGRNSEGDFIQLKDGRLLLIYSRFIGTGDHAAAELVGRFSADGGKTWDAEDTPIIGRNDSDANLMSVSLLRLADGRIALFYIQKYKSPPGLKYPFLDNILMRTSTDEGKTWSKPIQVVPGDQPGYRVLNNDRVIQLKHNAKSPVQSSGRLVVPLAVHYKPGWPGFQGSAEIVCYLSDDDGKSWRASKNPADLEAVGPGAGRRRIEGWSFVDVLPQPRLPVALPFRGWRRDWTPLTRSEFTQPTTSPASIERILDTGDLLMVWNNGDDPLAAIKPVGRRPFTAAVSQDDGATWEHVRNLGTDPEGWYCYTAIHFADKHVILAHSEYPRLNSLQVTRVPVQWLYDENDGGRKDR